MHPKTCPTYRYSLALSGLSGGFPLITEGKGENVGFMVVEASKIISK